MATSSQVNQKKSSSNCACKSPVSVKLFQNKKENFKKEPGNRNMTDVYSTPCVTTPLFSLHSATTLLPPQGRVGTDFLHPRSTARQRTFLRIHPRCLRSGSVKATSLPHPGQPCRFHLRSHFSFLLPLKNIIPSAGPSQPFIFSLLSILVLSLQQRTLLMYLPLLYFFKPSPFLHDYYFRPLAFSSSPLFHQGILILGGRTHLSS